MSFYETPLEVVSGAFTLRDAVHASIAARVPECFSLEAPLTHFFYSCDCQCFETLSFGGYDGGTHVGVYAGNTEWEFMRIGGGRGEAADAIVLRVEHARPYVHESPERVCVMTTYESGATRPASCASWSVDVATTRVPAALLEALRLRDPASGFEFDRRGTALRR